MSRNMLKLGTSLGLVTNSPKYLVIHSSDDSYKNSPDQFNKINIYHRDERKFPISSLGYYGGYHYLYTGGKEYQYRKEDEVGAHCNQSFDGIKVYLPGTPGKLSMNYQSVGLCIGFDGDIQMPPTAEYDLFQKRVWQLQDKYSISNENVFFHHYFTGSAKTCPGLLIDLKWLFALLKRPQSVPTASCTAENDTINRQRSIISILLDTVDRFFHRA